MDEKFGTFIRERREALRAQHGAEYSLRSVAARIKVSPSYLSRFESNTVVNRDGTLTPPTEAFAVALADALHLDRNVTLAMAGLVSSELKEIILKRPVLFAEILTALKDQPDTAILKVVREVRDGEW